ncbi:Phospholipid:diacylglycerol acyltransferase [Trichinella pseudospiralis]
MLLIEGVPVGCKMLAKDARCSEMRFKINFPACRRTSLKYIFKLTQKLKLRQPLLVVGCSCQTVWPWKDFHSIQSSITQFQLQGALGNFGQSG